MRDAVSEWGEHPIYPRNHAVVRRRWHSARDPLTSTSRSARPICLSLSALSHSVRAYTESSRTMTLPRELEVSRETFTRTTAVFAARARGAPPAGRVPVHGDDARNLAGPVRADADLAGCRRGLRSAFQRKRLARCAKPQHGPREDALGRRGRIVCRREAARALGSTLSSASGSRHPCERPTVQNRSRRGVTQSIGDRRAGRAATLPRGELAPRGRDCVCRLRGWARCRCGQ